ncbi:MAG: glycosyltransferase [Phycisphaerales bacterium]|nr:glycosyltransferase [Planctomycetota bacterium]
MHVAIYEPYPQGHRFTYVRHVVNALRELPVRLTLITSPGASKTESFRQQLAPLQNSFALDESVAPADPGQGKFALALAHAASLAHAAGRVRPDHLIVPAADGTLEMLGARRLSLRSGAAPAELEAMLMSTSWAYNAPGPRRRAKAFAWSVLVGASAVRTLHVIDPIVYEAYQDQARAIARRTVLAPDPVEAIPEVSKADARARLGIPTDGRLVSCVGRLDARKGVDLLVRAFLDAPTHATDRLLLMGKVMPEVGDLLAADAAPAVRSGRIIVVDGYVPDETMNLANAACDLVGVVYRHHSSSSSILIRAAAQRRPVLTTNLGWMGRTCRQFGLGFDCNIRNPGELAETLARALSSQWSPAPASARFVEFHSIPNALAYWSARIRERLNLPALPRRTWAWVLEAAPEHG